MPLPRTSKCSSLAAAPTASDGQTARGALAGQRSGALQAGRALQAAKTGNAQVTAAQHLDTAQGGLISKADVENETYLFRAACAELSTEVKNNRRVADEQLRQQRTFLQHEVDNTTQALTQELATLNDNVKGMFNDRKMAVREEQKAAESAVSFDTPALNLWS